MPHFNYYLSLDIYFPKSSIQTLANTFYYCLYKLFKFKIELEPSVTNNKLEKIGIFSFQHHILIKLGSFIHKIYNKITAPKKLKEQLNLINDKIKYTLRSNITFHSSETKFSHYGEGEQTFNYFTSKFLNESISLEEILLNYNLFKRRILIL